jgi:hypothetical protein
MNRWNLYAAVFALAAIAMPATGGVIFEIGSVFTGQGLSGTIEVDVQNTGDASIVSADSTLRLAPIWPSISPAPGSLRPRLTYSRAIPSIR